MEFWIVANPGNRRVTLFCEALRNMGFGAPRIFSYASLLKGEQLPAIDSGQTIVLRIESPGEDSEVRRGLVLKGSRSRAAWTDTAEIDSYSRDHGRIGYSRDWYHGYTALLNEIETHVAGHSNVLYMNTPTDISRMFDKSACHQLFRSKGIPVPRTIGRVAGYEELKEAMSGARMHRVFVKPAHNSSASGVVAFRLGKGKLEAVTSAEIIQEQEKHCMYNSLKVRRYTSEKEIALIMNTLLKEEAVVEEWIPKAAFNNQVFDLRILVAGGSAKHTVARMSRSPITNLHLGNQRGDLSAIENYLGKAKLDQARQLAEQAKACFPDSLYAGVDVLISADHSQVKVLEINAFGDLLPGLMHEGDSTYTAEIKEIVRRQEIMR